ncbi:hypothetical protein KC901_02620 [Patescibacteria group bacterium]|nr:hypothetical protein [Patescibacteria group bacterium]
MLIHLQQKERGFLKWILIIVIAIIIASYFFDFSLQDAVEDEQTQSNLGYIWDHIVTFYDSYLRQTVEWLWDFILEQIALITG